MSGRAAERAADIDELLLWWAPLLSRRTDLSDWERRFCADMAAKGRRRGWWPSPKQAAALRRIVSDARDGAVLIDNAA